MREYESRSLDDLEGDVARSERLCKGAPAKPLFFCDSYIIDVAEADSPPREEEACSRLPLPGLLFLLVCMELPDDDFRDFTNFITFFILCCCCCCLTIQSSKITNQIFFVFEI